jgi:hypothetical protein
MTDEEIKLITENTNLKFAALEASFNTKITETQQAIGQSAANIFSRMETWGQSLSGKYEESLKKFNDDNSKEFSAFKTKFDLPLETINTKLGLLEDNLKLLEKLVNTVSRELSAKKKSEIAKGLSITTIPYPKWWRELRTTAIEVSGEGTATIIPSNPNFNIYVATIVLFVTDETNISLGFGVFGSSGTMIMGGGSYPSGMVIAMGNSPAPCGHGSFSVSSDGAAVTVGGFVTYYLEKDIEQAI